MPALFGRNLTERQLRTLVGDPQQIFGVRLLQYADGPERGVRTLAFDTGGGLKFEVLIDRCMDIGSLHYMGVPIGWQSPTGFRSPWLHEGGAENGLGFLRSFSGFMNTCGLDHVLAPATEAEARYGRPSAIRHDLHGRASYTPARLAGYGSRWEDERCVLWAEGEIRQAAVAGENLHLIRRIEAEVGSNSVTVSDKVINRGFQSTPHMILYHINLGWPLLDHGTEFRAPTSMSSLVGEGIVENPNIFRFQSGPETSSSERVFDHMVVPDANGKVNVALINRNYRWDNGSSGLTFTVEYDHAALPGLLQWQWLEEGCYVVGIEPSTVCSGNRVEQEDRGEIRWLAHDQSYEYELTFSVFAGALSLAKLD